MQNEVKIKNLNDIYKQKIFNLIKELQEEFGLHYD